MRAFVSGIAVLLLAGCAASGDQQDQAMREMISCMKERATQLDDHRSDAETIGYAVRSACSAQVRASIGTHENGFTLSTGANPQIENNLWRESLATATQVVLLERNAR